MIFIWLVLLYGSLYYFKEWLDRRKYPPGLASLFMYWYKAQTFDCYLKRVYCLRLGPWPIPILGNLVQIGRAGKEPHLAFSNIAKQYNTDITRLKMGGKEFILLSSYEAMTEILTHPDALGRPLDGIMYDRNGGGKHRRGLVFKDGKSWEKRRAWVVRTLRDFGFDKSGAMEVLALEMIDEFLNKIKKQLPTSMEGVIKVEHLFVSSVFKIMWKMLCGQCTQQDEVVVKELLNKSDIMIKSGTFGTGILNIFPFVKYLLPEWTGFNVQMDFYKEARKAARDLLGKINSNMEGTEKREKPSNLTEAYISKMQSGDEPIEFNELDFEVLFIDILQAASDTTSSLLEACCLFAILHPETQAKVYTEIQETIPKAQNASYADLKNMTYTQAFFMEVHRCTKIVQLSVPRNAGKDLYYKNYLIKAGSTILVDFHTIFNSEKVGKDPETFRPERFIREDGELAENIKYTNPFSVGKRNCPGESLAEVASFLFFVMILKNYELSTVPGKTPPTTEMKVGLSSKPKPFEMWVKKRGD